MPRPPHIPSFDAIVGQFVESARSVVDREVSKFADTEHRDFVNAIKAQDFRSFKAFPLSWRTIQKKIRWRRGTKTMIATKTYINAIAVHREPEKGRRWKLRLVVGIDERLPSRDITGKLRPDVSLQRVARIQEYGAPRAGIPARPHWGPWLVSMTQRAKKVRTEIARLVVRDWKRRMSIR